MHELRTEKPWQHGVGPGFNSRRLHAEAPVPPYGAGAFLFTLGSYRSVLWSKELVFLGIPECTFGTNVARRLLSDQVWPSLQYFII